MRNRARRVWLCFQTKQLRSWGQASGEERRLHAGDGVPSFPDPSSNGRLPNPALPAFRAAKKACAKLQPAGLHLHGPPEPSAAELRAALTFARCMRKHGVSRFPDPFRTVSLVATLTLGPGEYFPAPGPTEFQSPAFRHAAKACGLQLPAGPPP